VIENELAARILLAFDVKQPWSCHQTYRLFDELHSDIFGRPEVDGLRITTTYKIYQLVLGKLALLENQLFARYTITRFLVLYLLREALEKDPLGKEFCLRPEPFVGSSKSRQRLDECLDRVAQVVLRILDSEVKRRDADPAAPFDYKRDLKSSNSVREIASTVVSHYQIAVDSKLALTFSDGWKSKNGKKK